MLQRKSEVNKIKIGVLQTRSKEYPQITAAFLDGIKLLFSIKGSVFNGKQVELFTEDVGIGAESRCLEQAGRLISDQKVDFLTGLLEPGIGLEVGRYASNFDVPTLITTLGESFVSHESMTSNLLLQSFGLWQRAYQEGVEAGKAFEGTQLTLVTSLFDSGYDHLRAFTFGFEEVNTAQIELCICKSYDEEELKIELESRLDPEGAIVVLLHPKLNEAFMRNFGKGLKLVANFSIGSLFGITSTSLEIPNQKNGSVKMGFQNDFQEFFEGQPSHYHWMGYCHGNLLHQACSLLQTESDTGAIWESAGKLVNEAELITEGIQLQGKGVVQGKPFSIPPALISALGLQKNAFSNPYLVF